MCWTRWALDRQRLPAPPGPRLAARVAVEPPRGRSTPIRQRAGRGEPYGVVVQPGRGRAGPGLGGPGDQVHAVRSGDRGRNDLAGAEVLAGLHGGGPVDLGGLVSGPALVAAVAELLLDEHLDGLAGGVGAPPGPQ